MQNFFLLFTFILQFIELGSVGKCFLVNWKKNKRNRKNKRKRTDSQNWRESKGNLTKISVTEGLSQDELGSSESCDGGPHFLGPSEEWSYTPIDRFCG